MDHLKQWLASDMSSLSCSLVLFVGCCRSQGFKVFLGSKLLDEVVAVGVAR